MKCLRINGDACLHMHQLDNRSHYFDASTTESEKTTQHYSYEINTSHINCYRSSKRR
ncbi:hypothetical protein PSP6_280124 [Paraburkholderia tropica]|nr:hypothetical protein PSP6_280124 [Paraburkholderia tropica]